MKPGEPAADLRYSGGWIIKHDKRGYLHLYNPDGKLIRTLKLPK